LTGREGEGEGEREREREGEREGEREEIGRQWRAREIPSLRHPGQHCPQGSQKRGTQQSPRRAGHASKVPATISTDRKTFVYAWTSGAVPVKGRDK